MRSYPLTIDEHQGWAGSDYPHMLRAHWHGVSNDFGKGFSKVTRSGFAVDVFPPCELAGQTIAPSFSRIQIGSRYLPLSHSRVRKFSRCASGAHSMTHKPLSQSLAYGDRVHRSFPFLGRTDREVSCGPEGFGNARKAFGEFRNV